MSERESRPMVLVNSTAIECVWPHLGNISSQNQDDTACIAICVMIN
jgi:hypothetical protein